MVCVPVCWIKREDINHCLICQSLETVVFVSWSLSFVKCLKSDARPLHVILNSVDV